MPAVIVPLGFAQNYLRFSLAGDNEEMVTTLACSLDGTANTPEEVAQEMSSLWIAAYPANSFTTSATFVGVTSYVGQDGGPPASGEFLNGTAGTSASAMLPNNCALLVRKNTGLGGRRNRGRCYLPSIFIGEANVGSTGVIDPGTVAAHQNRWNNLLGAMEGSGAIGPPQLLHSSLPSVPTPIQSFTVQTRIATQRTRMRR